MVTSANKFLRICYKGKTDKLDDVKIVNYWKN